jgi:hypothetical protein
MSKALDSDIIKMSPAELRQELRKMRKAFRKELEDTGNCRCWINLVDALPEGKHLKPLSLKREEFLKNCAHYFDRNQPKKRSK